MKGGEAPAHLRSFKYSSSAEKMFSSHPPGQKMGGMGLGVLGESRGPLPKENLSGFGGAE